MNDTIAAISTGLAASGVAVIRISGAGALSAAEKMFKPAGKTAVKDFLPNVMYAGEISADGFNDFGLCVYFKRPKSFTGEDTVEFHSHGGVAITRGIMRKIFSLGVRPAENGEFTRRAFLNGKLSLASAEGLIDMINSESDGGVKAGYYLYREKLTREIEDIQSEVTSALSEIDADMDFPEEGLELNSEEAARRAAENSLKRIRKLLSTYRTGRQLKSGVRVSIIGKPNTGKSSLLNALLSFDRAIVSDEAGTTRDVVEGSIEIKGIRFNFSDTAGIRESDNKAEKAGVELSRRTAKESDLIIFLVDGGNFGAEDEEIYRSVAGENVLVAVNKTDKPYKKYGKADIYLSAATGENVEKLKEEIFSRTIGKGVDVNGDFLCEERHYDALRRAEDSFAEAEKEIGKVPTDLIAMRLKEGWDALGEITGKTASEDIIDDIFGRFCVGK